MTTKKAKIVEAEKVGYLTAFVVSRDNWSAARTRPVPVLQGPARDVSVLNGTDHSRRMAEAKRLVKSIATAIPGADEAFVVDEDGSVFRFKISQAPRVEEWP